MNTLEFLTRSWKLDFFGLGLLVLVMAAYGIAIGRPGPRRWPPLAAAAVIWILTLCSPVGTLADEYLFSAHMLQHLVLLLIVPALLLLALPEVKDPKERAWPKADRAGTARNGLGWLAGVGAMWVWHAPTLCNAATTDPWVRRLQLVSLLVLGTMFWWPILGPRPAHRLPPLTGIVYLFTACLACTLLGIYITFTPVSVCSVYVHPPDRLGILPLIRQGWGLTPWMDQQIGGLMMWVPACLIYLGGIIGLLARWYRGEELEHDTGPSLGPTPPPGLAPTHDNSPA